MDIYNCDPRWPICLYDFTVKSVTHDCLNFSTRHMNRANLHRFVNYRYIVSQQDEMKNARDNSKISSFNDHLRNLAELDKLCFNFTEKAEIPRCLPLQRGVHVCNKNFVNAFT